jgi:hypothetical protein
MEPDRQEDPMKRFLLLIPLSFGACGSDFPLAVPPGPWGGHNAELRVGGGGASALFKCGAKGEIGRALALDATGHFAAAGTYDPVLVTGGPRIATYVGSISGPALTLEVQLEGATLGPFDLTRNEPARFDVCNFQRAAPWS